MPSSVPRRFASETEKPAVAAGLFFQHFRECATLGGRECTKQSNKFFLLGTQKFKQFALGEKLRKRDAECIANALQCFNFWIGVALEKGSQRC